jgi:hypothetical protein
MAGVEADRRTTVAAPPFTQRGQTLIIRVGENIFKPAVYHETQGAIFAGISPWSYRISASINDD